jgi:SAM-dependent methyltransferase
MNRLKILNLGCGTHASPHPDVINIDWSMYLRIRRNPVGRCMAPRLLRGERLKKYRTLPDNVLVHDLSKGIPFADESVDAVFHSHTLEHLDRKAVPGFLAEIYRVLRAGGVHRIVVPDYERRCRAYIDHLERCDDPSEARRHDAFVAALLEQSVRKDAFGSAHQKPWRKRLEQRLLGDARRRGETHQWMYDRVNLRVLLEEAGFREVEVTAYGRSRITDYEALDLDVDEHRDESLVMEASK